VYKQNNLLLIVSMLASKSVHRRQSEKRENAGLTIRNHRTGRYTQAPSREQHTHFKYCKTAAIDMKLRKAPTQTTMSHVTNLTKAATPKRVDDLQTKES
jgi:hypothetical protein